MKKKAKVVKPANPIGYKVVLRDGKDLVSCSKAGLRVKYLVRKFVRPRTFGGPLTLFSDKFTAIGFIHELAQHKDAKLCKVYRAEYIPTTVNYVWRWRDGGMKGKFLNELPKGTVLARRIKILNRVF